MSLRAQVSKVPTKLQISAGGVAYRKHGGQIDVALISVGSDNRWQLPKGIVDKGESTEFAALREVREETGIDAEMIDRIDKVEYWYFSKEQGHPVRYHKFVYFYLLLYKSGDVRDHDSEVNEARWIEIDDAIKMLAFNSEKKIMEKAKELILTRTSMPPA
jgi:8-oxo-dGTP pyrophosphatase MutT (NUDIX family)